jgi:RNA polymerase sigma-54 factor
MEGAPGPGRGPGERIPMAIQQKLHTKLVQKLILTPSLQQAIKLLPMSTLELVDLLNQEVVENPMLEEVPAEELQPAEAAETPPQEQKAEADPAATRQTDTWDESDYEYFFGEYLDDGYRPRMMQEVRELPPIENTLSTSSSLSDHLMWQLSLRIDDDLVRDIGVAIIGNLNDDGYLVASVEEIAAMGGWTPAEVEQALAVVQNFDPVGVGARDLQECLTLQLRHLGLGGTPTERIVTEHLRLLQNHQIPELARKLGLSIEELKDHIEIIRQLDPKPGSRLNPAPSQYVIPDVYVQKVEDQYVAALNEDGLPQLRISPVYRRLLDKSVEQNEETRAYVKEKFRSALWLIKSVDQRQKTIHKVATSIINFQRDFLDHGIEHLRPLVLRDVANDIGMHESTVSRVVNNKYMHTPQGVFEMKFFFHSGISSSYGESVSSVTIKQRIRKIIQGEDTRRPLSDSKIVGILQKEGLMLARRTIAKYREELKIPTSNQRKVPY